MTSIVAAAVPAFLASLVEFIEALTIVLAVGSTRGWRSALLGVAAGAVALLLLLAVFGTTLTVVPETTLKLIVGVLLLLFGMRWLRKAVLRSAGIVALHDETATFERERSRLAGAGDRRRLDVAGLVIALKAVVLEGLEVVFIVIAVGTAARTLVPPTVGAAAAGLLVIGAGAVVRKPLSRVPENALKFWVGVMLTAFGTFWTGEAFSIAWPGADASIVALVAAFAATAFVSILVARSSRAGAVSR